MPEIHERINRYDEMWECSCGAYNEYGNVDGPTFAEHIADRMHRGKMVLIRPQRSAGRHHKA